MDMAIVQVPILVMFLITVKKRIDSLSVFKFKSDFPRIGIRHGATGAARNLLVLKPELVSAKFDHSITSADSVTAGFKLTTNGNLKKSGGLPWTAVPSPPSHPNPKLAYQSFHHNLFPSHHHTANLFPY